MNQNKIKNIFLKFLGKFNKKTVYVYHAKIKMFHDLGITDIKLKGLQKKEISSYDRNGIADWSIAHISKYDFNLLKLTTENLSMIYEGARVKAPGGRINLIGTGIRWLPDNLTIDGDLIVDTDLEEIPRNLTVNGNFNLTHSKVCEITKSLKVTGYLDVTNSKIPKDYIMPHSVEIGGEIKGLNFY